MSINWEEFDIEIDDIIESSGSATDEVLASRMSSITRMTDGEIQELFPKPSDAKKLKDLMRIVKSSENRNIKIGRIVENAENFGGIMLTLLQKFT